MQYDNFYGGRTVASAPSDVRADFIRKVYGLFFASLLITVGVGWFCAQIARTMIPLLMPLLIAGLIVGVIMSFTQRVQGLNLAMLFLYSAIQGAVFGPILMMVERFAPGVPSLAGTLTIGIFGGLSLYVFTTKKDFSFLGGFLFVGIIGMVIAGLVMFFIHAPLLSMVYSLFGILLFCGYILYDTSNIMNRLGPDQAVSGAIGLYLDAINLFWFILRLLMSLNDRR